MGIAIDARYRTRYGFVAARKGDDSVQAYVAIAIVTIWGLSFVNALITGNYLGFEVSTPVMSIATPLLLGSEFLRRRNGDR